MVSLLSQKSTRCFINSILSTLSGRDQLDVLYRLEAAGGKGEFRGRFDIEDRGYLWLYSCNKGARLRDKALRLLAGLQLPGTPAEGHSSLLVLDLL